MSLPKIRPVHRPQIPPELLDTDLRLYQISDEQLLADLGMSQKQEAVRFYRGRLRRAANDRGVGRLLETVGLTDREELEEICRNVFTLRAHMHIKHDFGERVDWTTVLDGDVESNVAINYHWHIMQLAIAYHRLGEPRYAHHAVRLLKSWFEQSPAPESQAVLQWRTLEVGGRLGYAWPIIGICLYDFAEFDDDVLFDLVRWTWMSVRHLRRHTGPPNNWLQVESSGALAGLAFLGDIPAARGWTDLFWKRLEWIDSHHFLPDGMQAENSPAYHLFPWSREVMMGIWIEAFGGALPEDYWDRQVQRAGPMWMLCQPDGTLPMLSDCGPQPARPHAMLRLLRDRVGHDRLPDLDALSASERSPSEHRLCHLPYAGYTVVRTGWNSGDEFVLFDHGFYGTNHQHEDKLTFLYAARGRLLIGDAGIYRYSRDEWEHYFRGAYGHNVVMVDGKQQCRTLRAWQGRYETLPDEDCRYREFDGGAVVMSGWYRDGFAERLHHLWDRNADRSDELSTLDETVQHQRVLVYLPGCGLLIVDRLDGNGPRSIDQIFHLMPFASALSEDGRFWPGEVEVAEPAACLLPSEGRAGVLLVASDGSMAWSDHCGSREPLRGWTSLYGIQPSHDLWRSGRLDLPAVLAVWIEPWLDQQPPDAAELSLRRDGDAVRFAVQVNGRRRAAGAVHLERLDLEMQT